MVTKDLASEPDCHDCLFSSHAWKIVQETLDGVPRLQIIDQGLHWYARADKYRRSAISGSMCTTLGSEFIAHLPRTVQCPGSVHWPDKMIVRWNYD